MDYTKGVKRVGRLQSNTNIKNGVRLNMQDQFSDLLINTLPDIVMQNGGVIVKGNNRSLIMRRGSNGIFYEYDDPSGNVINGSGTLDNAMRNRLYNLSRDILSNGGSIQDLIESREMKNTTIHLHNLSTMKSQKHSTTTTERLGDHQGNTPYNYESEETPRVGCGCRKPKQ